MAVLIEPEASMVPKEIEEFPSILYKISTSAVTALTLNEKITLLDGLFGTVNVTVNGV